MFEVPARRRRKTPARTYLRGMHRDDRERWARIAMFAIPVLMFVGCRVGLRACVGFDRQRRAAEQTEVQGASDAGVESDAR